MYFSDWKIASGYIVGRGHIAKNMPCQDRTFKLKGKTSQGNFYGLALADGAGSCKHSDLGAEAITKKILYFIRSRYKYLQNKKNPSRYLLSFIEQQLYQIAQQKNIEVKELSSTLLCVTIVNNAYIICHIGDGVIGVLSENNHLNIVSYPENGEYANSTFFTTSIHHTKRLRVKMGILSQANGFILMSDGSQESLYDKRTDTLGNINKTIINWLSKASETRVEKAIYLNLEQFIARKTTDDCSIAIMRKSSPRKGILKNSRHQRISNAKQRSRRTAFNYFGKKEFLKKKHTKKRNYSKKYSSN